MWRCASALASAARDAGWHTAPGELTPHGHVYEWKPVPRDSLPLPTALPDAEKLATGPPRAMPDFAQNRFTVMIYFRGAW